MTGQTEEIQKIDRQSLIADLKSYRPDREEKPVTSRFLDLLKSDNCFYRDHFSPGHITASAILLNENSDLILMNYHKLLNRWLNFGGHCDEEEDALAVAIRETMEESGLTSFKPITPDIVDLDIHTIPPNPKRGEPAHEHFDIRFVMRMTQDQKPVVSDESLKLEWMTFDQALSIIHEDSSLKRFIEKVRNMIV